MESLDLTKRAPRSPRKKLGGLYMLARTIDKMRANLPGGNPGNYRILGFSTRMMKALGINADEMQAVVADARSEDEIVAWVQAHSDPASYDSLNQTMARRKVKDVTEDLLPLFVQSYGPNVPPDTVLFDLLEEDDRKAFA